MKRSKKMLLCLLLVFCSVLSVQQTVFADEPYIGYSYNEFDREVPSANGYVPSYTIDGRDIGVGSLKGPRDIFIDQDNDIYILDTGNGRIVITDSKFKHKKTIDKFYSQNGEETLKMPNGIFVTKDKMIYIADTENSRVLVCNLEGHILKIITKPESDIYPENVTFYPRKVVVDGAGNTYVLVRGMYEGAVMYNSKDIFIGFFGANRIERTVDVVADRFWKMFMTRTQKQRTNRVVSIEFSSIEIDNDGFIYTCTESIAQRTDRVKKINPRGVNLFDNAKSSEYWFGDRQLLYLDRIIDTALVDIDITDNGIINVLDFTRGRVFQYDQEANALLIFGGKGEQVGLAKSAVAIESIGEEIYVLDQDKARITAFQLTTFGKYVHQANELNYKGYYQEAVGPWKEVLKRDANYLRAYNGIGSAYLNNGEFKKAMDYFKLGYDKQGYNKAFKGYRNEILRDNFGLVVFIFFLIIFLPLGLNKYFKYKKKMNYLNASSQMKM